MNKPVPFLLYERISEVFHRRLNAILEDLYLKLSISTQNNTVGMYADPTRDYLLEKLRVASIVVRIAPCKQKENKNHQAISKISIWAIVTRTLT